MSRPPRVHRDERRRRAVALAAEHDGVVHRRALAVAGITRHDVRTEVRAGRWRAEGRHTVAIGSGSLSAEASRARAVWESGGGAVLDGVSALQASGLRGLDHDTVDVAMPMRNRYHALDGVRLHRRRVVGPTTGASIERATGEWATIRAAQWARTDREAALVICLPVQQRLVHPTRLLAAWSTVRRSPRRAFLDTVLRDVCDGAHSLGELDLGALCRQRGLPAPDRQIVRQLPGGRAYLDAGWDDVGLALEIDGGHHALALDPVDDAFRANEVVIGGDTVLRLPVLALRLDPVRCLDQVARARTALAARRAA